MKKSGLTQEKLADATGISQPTISRYLRAETEPKVGDFALIANALGISMDELWTSGAAQALHEATSPYGIDWRARAEKAEVALVNLKSKMRKLSED